MLTKNALNNGIFLGIVLILSSFSFYLANPQMFVEGKSQLLFVPFLILLFKTGTDARRKAGGYIEFAELFKDMFFAAAIGTLFCTIFEHLLFNFIDPELKVMMAESMKEVLEERGLDDNFIYQMSLKQIESGEYFSVLSSIIDYFRKLVAPSALMSALFALIMKRKKQLPNNKTV